MLGFFEEMGFFLTIIYLISFIVWVVQLIRLSKRKDKSQLWLILVLGLVFFFIMPVWAIVSLCLGRGEEEGEDREEES